MMHHTYKIERVRRHILAGALTNGHHWERRCPIHIIAIGIACASTAWVTIKGEIAVQGRYMGYRKISREGKDIHIRARRQMCVYDVEALLFDVFHSFL